MEHVYHLSLERQFSTIDRDVAYNASPPRPRLRHSTYLDFHSRQSVDISNARFVVCQMVSLRTKRLHSTN